MISPGSSPLTRGKRPPCWARRQRPGLIPAHAGKTPRRRRGRSSCAAHPRSRGENRTTRPNDPPRQGSSPLTRGKLSVMRSSGMPTGLIPAHAGKTGGVEVDEREDGAHPRSRGENFQIGIPRSASWGSSPLTRGKLPSRRARTRPRGLIPAHAGKTQAAGTLSRASRAHPRSRGENSPSPRPSLALPGSSPLTRGKRHALRRRWQGSRLIPAHAGKTPRTMDPMNIARLIPAHAGKTPRRREHPSRIRAHPRSRGENGGFS